MTWTATHTRQRGPGRRAAVLAIVVGFLLQGCAAAADGPAGGAPADHPCGRGVDARTARTVDVYVAVMRRLLQDAGAAGSDLEVLYLVERPTADPAGVQGDHGAATGSTPAAAPLPEAVRRCLGRARFTGLPAIRLVSGVDDSAIRRAPGLGPIPRFPGGRVVTVAPVPPDGDRLLIAASSDGGGGLGVAGGVYVVERHGGAWRVTGQERSWIS